MCCGALAGFPLGEGQSATFVLRVIAPDAHPGRCPGTEEAGDWFKETVDYWQRWAARCPNRERSSHPSRGRVSDPCALSCPHGLHEIAESAEPNPTVATMRTITSAMIFVN